MWSQTVPFFSSDVFFVAIDHYTGRIKIYYTFFIVYAIITNQIQMTIYLDKTIRVANDGFDGLSFNGSDRSGGPVARHGPARRSLS